MTVHQYLRVSTQHQLQGDKLGLALQLTGMNDYCAKHNSGERVVVHSDEGISGSALWRLLLLKREIPLAPMIEADLPEIPM